MNERINWMDWAKFLSVALVVPVHIPQATGAQPVTWFMVFLLACLMFNSGYLKKERTNLKEVCLRSQNPSNLYMELSYYKPTIVSQRS